MGKKDLIGGTLWENYSHKVAEHMNNPRNMGELTESDAAKLDGKLVVADWGAESCGDAVRLYWIVDKNEKIIRATFKSFGCGTAIASSDMMSELCIGKTVSEALSITNIDVEEALRDNPDTPAVPPQKMHCSVMAYDVIKQAVAVYRGVDRESLEDEVIVCECARVTLKTIQEVIRLNDLKTVEEITSYTKAGAFCKSCIRPGGHEKKEYYLEDILRDTRALMDQEEANKKGPAFDTLSTFQKSKAIEKVFDQNVRPALAGDGGGLEMMDVREQDGELIVSIQYLGACMGCASAGMGTLSFIKDMLADNIETKQTINVEIAH